MKVVGMSRELEAALEIAVNRGDITRAAAHDMRELERNLQRGIWVVRGTGQEINLEETPEILEDFWAFITQLCERYGTWPKGTQLSAGINSESSKAS
jgi:hypothetical protein